MSAAARKAAAALHRDNRARLVARFAARAAAAGPRPLVALLQGGEQQTRHATDTEILFRQESYFAWAFGVREPGCLGLLNLSSGEAVLAVPRHDAAYAVWSGELHPPEHFCAVYGVDRAVYVDELGAVVQALAPAAVFLLSGLNTDSKKTHAAPVLPNGVLPHGVDVDTAALHAEMNECRVIKTPAELELMRYVNRVSSRAHVEVMLQVRPGMREYELEAIFLGHTARFGGCRHASYTCICGAGAHGAVLHYGHAAAPNDGTVDNGALALLDMGAEYHTYASDITCTYPVNGKFTDKQRNIYNIVLKAQLAVFAAMKPGVAWADMHRLAERVVAEELIKLGLIKGNIDDVVRAHVATLFFPHGLGHLMGVDVHDVGGYPAGMERIKEPGLQYLRTARRLEAGMVLTVEPGVYFIDALLLKAYDDPQHKDFLNRDVIDQYRGMGGVRLEDDVIVTATGIENMTIVPRTVEEIEDVMARRREWVVPEPDSFQMRHLL